MVNDIFSKWDASINVEGLQKDVEEAATSGKGEYKEVPHGMYEVGVTKLELVSSKKGDPMVSIWFKVLVGEYKNSLIFFNQVITQGFQIHIVNDLLRSMLTECGVAPNVEFKTYSQYGNLMLDVFEAIDDNFEFALNYEKGKNGFNKYTIEEVFTLEG